GRTPGTWTARVARGRAGLRRSSRWPVSENGEDAVMERIWASTDGAGDLSHRMPADDLALPSRGDALAVLRPAIEAQGGPVLVTGEPGVGKPWVWRRLQAEMGRPWRWLAVDVPPGIDPPALYRLIGHGLGIPAPVVGARCHGDEGDRLALADFLREAADD